MYVIESGTRSEHSQNPIRISLVGEFLCHVHSAVLARGSDCPDSAPTAVDGHHDDVGPISVIGNHLACMNLLVTMQGARGEL
jgi:hypothetical protein